jgi:hypothetical protein
MMREKRSDIKKHQIPDCGSADYTCASDCSEIFVLNRKWLSQIDYFCNSSLTNDGTNSGGIYE